jgi:hypothetical protein
MPEMNTKAGEALVEAAKDVEDERAILDWRPKGSKLIRHFLEAPTVVDDGQVTLGEGVELDVEEEDARLLVPQEYVFVE